MILFVLLAVWSSSGDGSVIGEEEEGEEEKGGE